MEMTTLLSVAVLTSSGHVTAYHRGAFYAVCAGNWSSVWSAGVCRDVASSTAMSMSTVSLSRSLYLHVTNSSLYDISQLSLSSRCLSGAGVRVVCRDAACGLPASSTRPRVLPYIIGGDIAPDGAWPWAAALLYKGDYLGCTASLIATDWLLTAAHCFFQNGMPVSKAPWYITARLGLTQRVGYSRQLRVASVRHVVLHPDYRTRKDAYGSAVYQYNDLALVQLGDDLLTPSSGSSSSSSVSSVCLVDNELHPLSTLKTWQCYAIGWGLSKNDGDGE